MVEVVLAVRRERAAEAMRPKKAQPMFRNPILWTAAQEESQDQEGRSAPVFPVLALSP